jgi:hypothetical protein
MPRRFRSIVLLAFPFALILHGCNSSQTDTRTPVTGAAFTHSTDCALGACLPERPFGDDWCKGGDWHWFLRGDFYTTACVDPLSVKVYVVTTAGDRIFFARDTHVQSLGTTDCGHKWQYAAQSIAPRDSIGDNDRGVPRFDVEVYTGGKSAPFATFTVYSDVPLAPNTDFERRFCPDYPYPDPHYPKRQNPEKN